MGEKMKTYGKTLQNFPSSSVPLSPSDPEVLNLMHANGLYNRRDMDWYNKFVRFPGVDPYNAMTVTHEYVFFTKPDLHLLNTSNGNIAHSLAAYTFFNDAISRYRPICEQLQFSCNRMNKQISKTDTSNPFMSILTNSLTSELQVPGIDVDHDVETGANVYGTKITYRGNSYTSDQDLSFDLEFEDTKYLEVYMLFKIYDEYCKYKNLGLIELDTNPNSSNYNDDLNWINYVYNRILHDQFSVYKFVVGEDGMTLIYWGKYTGVYPTSIPRDAFSSMNNQDTQKLTVSFKAQFFRDMDPVILTEFNSLTIGNENKRTAFYSKTNLPLYNTNYHAMEGRWSSMPFIADASINEKGNYVAESDIDKMTRYRLLWKN